MMKTNIYNTNGPGVLNLIVRTTHNNARYVQQEKRVRENKYTK
jgi:hypothetical protein